MFDYDYDEHQIFYNDRNGMSQLDALLKNEGIRRDESLEFTLGLFENEQLVATGSVYKNTLRCLAVASDHQGEGLMNRVVSRLIDYEAAQGNYHLFLYTKCEKTPVFRDLGFYEIARVEGTAAFLENRRDGFQSYLDNLSASRRFGRCAAVVMNANPFTVGHQALVCRAASENDWLHLFVVSEDASLFPFSVRYALVRAGTADLKNVILHTTGSYMISQSVFPSYFLKQSSMAVEAQARLDVQIFVRAAACLGISSRYAGEEPFSQTTSTYNRVMSVELKKNGLHFFEIPRAEVDGAAVSASAVRQLLQHGRLDDVRKLVPETTYEFFSTHEGKKIIDSVQNAGDVIHH